MTIERSNESTLSSAEQSGESSITRELSDIVAAAIDMWEGGAIPDAGKLIEAYPQFRSHHSLALELVYEEYCRRRALGNEIDITGFCGRFSWLSSSIRRMIEVHDVFENRELKKLEIVWPKVGSEICGFRIVAHIGTGGFSRVFVALQSELGDRLVTIKVAEKVYDEARLMGRLSHEAIVPVLSVHHDVPSGFSVICMPYLGAATLEDVVNAIHAQATLPTTGEFLGRVVASRNESLPAIETQSRPRQHGESYWQAVAEIALPIVDALTSAHGKGVIHRDIKPSNILLGPFCQLQLLDFNLSTDLHENAKRVGGTISYMPLEQLEVLVGSRMASELTSAVDIYAFGVVLYELLTGRLPFEFHGVDSLRGALVARRAGELAGFRSPQSFNRSVPANLDAVIMRCLREDAVERPTLSELRDSLHQLLQVPVERRRRQRRALITGSVALALGGTGGLTYYSGIGSLPVHDSGPLSMEQLVKQANQDLADARIDRALEGFQKAYRHGPNPWLALGVAECLTRQKNYRAAVSYWKLAKATFAVAPEAQCNYAHCLVQLRDFSHALELLDDVMHRSPAMQAAWLNRAVVLITHVQEPFPAAEAIRSIERAIEIGPASAEQFLYAAEIYARSMDQFPTSRSKGIQSLQEAVHLGAQKSALGHFPWVKAYNLTPDYSEFTDRSLSSTKRVSADQLARLSVPFPFPVLPDESVTTAK